MLLGEVVILTSGTLPRIRRPIPSAAGALSGIRRGQMLKLNDR
jgi:hypothetical protein